MLSESTTLSQQQTLAMPAATSSNTAGASGGITTENGRLLHQPELCPVYDKWDSGNCFSPRPTYIYISTYTYLLGYILYYTGLTSPSSRQLQNREQFPSLKNRQT